LFGAGSYSRTYRKGKETGIYSPSCGGTKEKREFWRTFSGSVKLLINKRKRSGYRRDSSPEKKKRGITRPCASRKGGGNACSRCGNPGKKRTVRRSQLGNFGGRRKISDSAPTLTAEGRESHRVTPADGKKKGVAGVDAAKEKGKKIQGRREGAHTGAVHGAGGGLACTLT